MSKQVTLRDVVDKGLDIVGHHIMLQMKDNKLFVVERIINGRPDSTQINTVPFTKAYLDMVSRETHTMINMLKADYTRYGKDGIYSNWPMNIVLVKVENALQVMFSETTNPLLPGST